MNKQLIHPKYRPDIDGLRAVSVLLVVIFHAFPDLIPGGFIGVDIFFVISGFLISTIIINNLENGTFSFMEFYQRRIRRIFPSLLLVLATCFIFGWFVLFSDEYAQLGKHIAGGAGFVSNLVLWSESGYFDNSAITKPLLHFWSLGIEEQFYFVWPAALWLAYNRKISLLYVSIGVGLASFILNIVMLYQDSPYTFYSPQTRFWELQVGAMLAFGMSHKSNALGNSLHNVRSIAGAILLAMGAWLITKNDYFPGWWALLPTIGAALLISAGAKAWMNRFLSNRPLVWIGMISYPLYLWHWPILSFLHIVKGNVLTITVSLVALLAAFILATLTYLLVEKQIRFNVIGIKTRSLATLMVVMGLIGFGTYTRNGIAARAIASERLNVEQQFTGPLWKYGMNDLCLKDYPFDEARKYSWWFCMASKGTKPTLLLLGNSYANHLYPGLALNASFQQQSVLSIGTCGPEWSDSTNSTTGDSKSPCSGNRAFRQMQFINSIIEKSGTVKFAILDGLSFNGDEVYIARVAKRIRFLEKNSVKVIVFVPHIHPEYSVKNCFARRFGEPQQNCEISLSEYKRKLDQFEVLEKTISATNPNVLFFNQNDLYCNSSKCSMIKNGVPLFRDEYAHLSEFGSIELGKVFESWARTNVPVMFRTP